MKSLTVQAASHRYPIYIGEGILQDFALFQQKIGKKVAIITNDVVAQWYLQPLESSLHAHGIEFFSIVLPDGEIYKNNEYGTCSSGIVAVFNGFSNVSKDAIGHV